MPDRMRKFKIEELTKGRLLIAYLLLLITFAMLLFIAGVFAPPAVWDRSCKRWVKGDEDHEDSVVTPLKFLVHRDPIVHQSKAFSNWNQDFFFYLTIYRKTNPRSRDSATIGFEIFPFKLYIVSLEKDQVPDWSKATTHERHLVCDRNSLNTVPCPTFPEAGEDSCAKDDQTSEHMCGTCRITLAHETFLSAEKPFYRLAVKVANTNTDQWVGLMNDVKFVETMYKYSNENFTLFEVYFRYMLLFVSVIGCMVFWVQNRYYHPFNDWALEQKWTFLLLVSLVMFNNPLFFLNIYAEHWIFPFLNIAFTNNYLLMYMLCVLLFTDNLYKNHRKLGAAAFYGPKLALMGLLWFVGIVSFAVTRSNQRENIAENDLENIQVKGYEVFKIVVGMCVGIYFIWLIFLIIRVVEQWSQDSMVHIARRIKFLWFTAVMMLAVIVAGLFELVLQRNEAMGAVQFFR
eukprot:NODE_485_length_1641_cov_85.317211_g345_i0.p1 GENE.NODE_485_length_1641_cov_85.317211_g345_i0~~NODE_485_length_1641_cov_85.317211_g345_i0.p1  ORF type:complete len:458 (-),score=126.39 NODE_485_length_1641_cov_85.317211_g345_i0:191-1564(-)